MTYPVSRRGVMAAGLASAALAPRLMAADAKPAPVPGGTNICFIHPDTVDGPYYENKAIIRSDITEGKKGIPIEVRVTLVDAQCRPLANARVDAWQADAQGIYSDFPNQGDNLDIATPGETFLRGTQTTDANGLVVFRSIYPGWYRGRTAHIHFKIYIDGRTRLTSQIFFPDALNEWIYQNVPEYQRPLTRDTINVTDWIMAEATRGAVAQVKEEADRYVVSITYGVNPLATPAPGEKMPCPADGSKCVPAPGVPPVGADRIAALVPSPANAARPRAAKPPLPKGWR
jgi:protocatechuate 3,4-dioxygenase beta subunit